jgi:hypothetical protein
MLWVSYSLFDTETSSSDYSVMIFLAVPLIWKDGKESIRLLFNYWGLGLIIGLLSKGIYKMNIDPLLTLDSTVMSPPKACARFLLTVRPNPTPSLLSSLKFMIFVNYWNNIFNWFLSIPTPESCTMIYICFLRRSIPPLTITCPTYVYLIAFETKFIIICLSLFSSIIKISGRQE